MVDTIERNAVTAFYRAMKLERKNPFVMIFPVIKIENIVRHEINKRGKTTLRVCIGEPDEIDYGTFYTVTALIEEHLSEKETKRIERFIERSLSNRYFAKKELFASVVVCSEK